jgi:hypothetical protein
MKKALHILKQMESYLLKLYSLKIYYILIIVIIPFSLTSYLMFQSLLNNFVARAEDKFYIIENFIDLSFDSADQILHGISMSLTDKMKNKQTIEKDTYYMLDHLSSTAHLDHEALPFYGFKIVNLDGFAMSNINVVFQDLFKVGSDLELIEQTKKNVLTLKVGNIRLSKTINRKIIPFCMGISHKIKYEGTICSGFILGQISSRLDHHVNSRHINKIELVDVSEDDERYRIGKSFTLSNIIRGYFEDKNLLVFQPISKYPFLILRAEVNCYYLGREIINILLLCCGYFIIFALLAYLSLLKITKNYINPLKNIQKNITQSRFDFLDKTTSFNELNLYNNILKIINNCHLLHSKQKKQAQTQIINSALLEQHYSIHNTKNREINAASLYLNEAKRLEFVSPENINLYQFTKEVTQYCSEHYNELSVRTIISAEDGQRDFKLKSAALIETVFNIFTAIIRIGKFQTESEIILRAGFFDDNNLPSLSIEVDGNGDSLLLGWELGPAYTYSSLLSVSLLAKENNFFFNIEQKGNKIIFFLDPIDQ